jgi:hypothetical protein
MPNNIAEFMKAATEPFPDGNHGPGVRCSACRGGTCANCGQSPGVPQVMEAEVLDAGPFLRLVPCGGALLDAFSW